MKQLICEMCGSNEVIKENGLFICQACGTKYSVEEAKKMMTESIKIDKSSEKENLKILAERYHDNGEYEKAENYYGKIIELDPYDWEAIYFKGLTSALASGDKNIYDVKINEAFIGVENALQIMDENQKNEKIPDFINDLRALIFAHGNAIHKSYNEDFSETDLINFYSGLYNVLIFADKLYTKIPPSYLKLNENDIDWNMYFDMLIWAQSITKSHSYQWGYDTRTGSPIYESFYASDNIIAFGKDMLDKYTKKMQEINPEFKFKVKENTGGYCYIATSIYGSYDCPEVWTLRRFRDYKLSKNILGKIFIKFYYTTSPTLVKYLGNTFIFKKIFKKILDNFVSKLNNKGYKSDYYNDNEGV